MNDPNNTDELMDAPLLRSIPQHDPFVVPDGFFDRFPQAVQERIAAQAPISWSDRLAAMLRPRVVVGSLAAIAIVATTWMLRPAAPSGSTISLGVAVEPEEVLSNEVDDELLFAALNSNEPLLDAVDLPLSDAELEAYLENEELPLDLLMEEL